MLFLIINKWQESGILQVDLVVSGTKIVSEVCSRCEMVLDDLQGEDLLLDGVEDVAPKASKTVRLLKYTLLGSANGQVVMNLKLPKITFLNNISGYESTLAESNNVDVGLVKDWVILDLSAVFLALFVH